MKTYRVEWIGAKSPLDDDKTTYLKITNRLNPEEIGLLEAVADMIAPLIRQYGRTVRVKGPSVGYSKTYRWGSRNFFQDMTERDMTFLFKHDRDQAEFRNHDDPAHDDRVPVVPQLLVDRYLYDILAKVSAGPLVRVGTPEIIKDARTLRSRMADLEGDMRERREFADRRRRG